jgi:hypothetical protein
MTGTGRIEYMHGKENEVKFLLESRRREKTRNININGRIILNFKLGFKM